MKNALKLLVGTLCLSSASVAMADLPANLNLPANILDLPTNVILRETIVTATFPPGETLGFGTSCHAGEVAINGVPGYGLYPGFTIALSSYSYSLSPNKSTWYIWYTNNNSTAQRVQVTVIALCTRGKVTYGGVEYLTFPE